MTDIIIIDRHEELSLLAVEALSGSFEIRFCAERSLYKTGTGQALNIWRTDRLNGLITENCIIVLGEKCISLPPIIPGSAIFVANAMNKEQMSAIASVTDNVITCGNLVMDTVSYTSVTDDIVTVSFGRTFTTLSGREVQPFEMPVCRNNNESIYSMLAVTALRVLLDAPDLRNQLL